MDSGKNITRRQFVKKAAGIATGAVAFPYIIPSSALGADGEVAPSNRINIAIIGLAGMGGAWWGHLPVLLEMPDVQVLALCDVQEQFRQRSLATAEKKYGAGVCKAYNDFREIIARDDIDAVVIASPDHWHAIMTIAAVKAGKHVYCEKPLTRTVAEGIAVREAIKKYGVTFQHGTQQRSDAKMVFGCELVLNGRIGKLKNVRMGIPGGERTKVWPTIPVPAGMDYNMWLGPAPWRPYNENRCLGGISHSWYFISDYCVGHLSGWGTHHVDSAQQGCGTDYTGPVEIEGKGDFPTEGLYDTAVTWKIKYTFANGVTWDCTDTSQNKMGVLFEGTDGWVYIWRNTIDAYPKSLLTGKIGPDEIHLYKSPEHRRNFLECIKTGGQTAAPIEIAHRSTTICSLGDIAMRLGRKLQWSPEKEQFIGDDEANRMLGRAYRSPWQL